ncbi:MAG: phosphonate metabolism protein/1,5-bisphosphokinase (PRPP-forming) PhnN [Paracoccus sp. (in: a-proteobacteria)]|nr:phosphonate metabolism protein/1,5-bisphosphokinase (PRPP-forming) PhnN [Paracoccus sp. (in: a-proteobacteria)]
MSARVIGIVGPSGVGKDTLMQGAAARHPGITLVQRVITRAHDAGGEDHTAVTPEGFARLRDEGGFALSWEAHGLCYGVPHGPFPGRVALVNLSRGVLDEAARVFPGFTAIEVTLPPEMLTKRLAARGREDASEIAARLARTAPSCAIPLTKIDNSGAPEQGIAALLSAIKDLTE